MDNRARASLTYRILTEVLGLALVLGAFSLTMVPNDTVALLVRNLVLYSVVFAVLITIWRRLSSLFDVGLLGGKFSAAVGMVIALNIALAPVLLSVYLANKENVKEWAAIFLTVDVALITVLMAILIYRSNIYRSKSHWRLAHHSLWFLSVIFFVSLAIPLDTGIPLTIEPVVEIPVGFLLWGVGLAALPLFNRIGSNFVANPAQPQRAPISSSSSSSNSTAVSASSSMNSSQATEPSGESEREGHESHSRPPQRRGGGGRHQRFRRHSGPSRRRM